MGETSIDKIVFLVSSPFNRRDEKRFGIEILRANGFEVEVWDLTPFLNPARFKKYALADKAGFQQYHVFLTKSETISAISKLTGRCLILCLLSYGYETYSIFRAISKYRLPYCLLGYSIPTYNVPREESLFARFRSLTPRKILTYLILRIPCKLLGVAPATMMFALGGEFHSLQFSVDAKTEFVWSHYFDYDVYLEQVQKPIRTDKSMGVFLDSCLPFHPDFIADPILSPEEYYPLLCRFFDYIESNYAVHVVIAAHPRSRYEDHPNCFGGRPVIRGKTSELVMQAGFVMLHSSASFAFAVLFKKPVIFVTMDRLRQGRAGEMIGALTDFMASTFGKRPINLNNTFEIDWTKELVIDEEAYRDYRNKYIKKEGTEDIPLWQVFANHLKKLKDAE